MLPLLVPSLKRVDYFQVQSPIEIDSWGEWKDVDMECHGVE